MAAAVGDSGRGKKDRIENLSRDKQPCDPGCVRVRGRNTRAHAHAHDTQTRAAADESRRAGGGGGGGGSSGLIAHPRRRTCLGGVLDSTEGSRRCDNASVRASAGPRDMIPGEWSAFRLLRA